jgi:hypothetical protein
LEAGDERRSNLSELGHLPARQKDALQVAPEVDVHGTLTFDLGEATQAVAVVHDPVVDLVHLGDLDGVLVERTVGEAAAGCCR